MPRIINTAGIGLVIPLPLHIVNAGGVSYGVPRGVVGACGLVYYLPHTCIIKLIKRPRAGNVSVAYGVVLVGLLSNWLGQSFVGM